ncbi:hypothetical protein Tco_1032635 [Tanacetum coccineum]|uniref:Reverse transcriptase domain-containing protein n=1 Tax=Tanacetum coccineum TaxID=301880 RepID=A0ABQ5GD75_9ASTR
MEELNNLQQEPDETLYQAWEHFKELLMKCPQHYLTEMHEVILVYNGLDVPTRQILDSRGVVLTKTVADAKKAIQEIPEYSQKWHNGTCRGRSTETSDGLAAIQAQLNNHGREIKKVGDIEQQLQDFTKGTTQILRTKNERKSMEYTMSKFIGQSSKRHEENSNLIKEIRASTDPAIRNQRAAIKTLEIQIGQMSKVLQERGFRSLPSSNETNPRDQVKSISTTIEADSHPIRCIRSLQYVVSTGQNRTLMYETRQTMIPFPNCLNGANVSVMHLLTYLNLGLGELAHTKLTVELADRTVKYPKGIAENVLVRIGKFTFPVDFIILDMPKDIKVSLILGRPFLSIAYAKIDVYKRNITLRVREENIIFKSVKSASSLINRVYMLSLRKRIELDLEARKNQGDDLMPTIEEDEVIDEFRTRNEDLDTGIDDYPCYWDYDKKIHIDCAHNLKFSCMIGFEFTRANFFPLLYVNVMSKKVHNSIIKDKMVYKGDNVVGALINVPIFVGSFSIMTDFAVLEDMDAYRDEGMSMLLLANRS